jgi:outer membrane protein assembly factor BamB
MRRSSSATLMCAGARSINYAISSRLDRRGRCGLGDRTAGTGHLKTWSGLLATAGGVVFYGDPDGAFVAVDDRNGKTLWHFNTNVGMKASPMMFAVDGKQFVAVAASSVFLCFGQPSP